MAAVRTGLAAHESVCHCDQKAGSHERLQLPASIACLSVLKPARQIEGKGVLDGAVAGQGGEEVAESGVHDVGGRGCRTRGGWLRPRVGVVHGSAAAAEVLHLQRAP